MRVELVYKQCNICDRHALFWCSAGQQAWLCSYLFLKFFTKPKAFVLIKLFLFLKTVWRLYWEKICDSDSYSVSPKDTSTQVFFSVIFAKFLSTGLLQNICKRLLLTHAKVHLRPCQRSKKEFLWEIPNCWIIVVKKLQNKYLIEF